MNLLYKWFLELIITEYDIHEKISVFKIVKKKKQMKFIKRKC